MSSIYENKMYSKFGVQYNEENNLLSHINIGYHGESDLLSSIVIRPNNRMYGKFKILAPPRHTINLPPIQDATVSKNAPTMNYGIGELDIGGNNSDIFRSYLQWDLNSLDKHLIFTKAIIHLKLLNNGQYNFNINEVSKSWGEYGITWKGQPPCKDCISNVIVENNVDEIIIDVLELVNKWYDDIYSNHGIMIKAVDEMLNNLMRLGSKETTDYEPFLEVQYFNPLEMPDTDYNLPSSITIVKDANILLNSSIEITNHFTENNLKSSIKIRIPDTLYSNIVIQKNNLLSTIVIPEIDNLSSHIIIQKNNAIDLNSHIIVRNDQTYWKVHISNVENLSSNIDIRKDKLLSSITISNQEILLSNVKISNEKNIELYSHISITKDTLKSNIQISDINIFPSSIVISNQETVVLPSNINITKDTLRNSITISNQEDLLSNISIMPRNDILTSNIVITNKNLPSKIVIPNVEDLSGQIIISNTKEDMLLSNINIYKGKQLPSNIEIKSEMIKCNIVIKNNNKLNCSISIAKYWYIDLPSTIIINYVEVNKSYGFIM
jgi:hypothetical protein